MKINIGDYVVYKDSDDNDEVYGLTINKAYQVLFIDVSYMPNNTNLYYTIKNDKKLVKDYSQKMFYTIKELRQEKLKRIEK